MSARPAPLLALVVPCYNEEETLPRTLTALAELLERCKAQGLIRPESYALYVDDGSHDGSAEVCDALAGQDARIRVFHQPNGGPAHARNTGLDNACGDYIGIVDSDDLIEPAMFETLYNAVQQPGVRLAACAADCIDAEGRRIEGRSVTIRQPGVRDAQELLLEAFQTGSFYGPLSWNKLFDARLFREKGIHYDETMLFACFSSNVL